MKKVLIFMQGGIISSVLKTDEDIEIIVIENAEDADEDEVSTAKEIDKAVNLSRETWIDDGFELFISDDDFGLSFK